MQSRIPQPIPDGLTVIETMRAEADGTIQLWPLHLQRLRRDCAAVGFPLDEAKVIAALGNLSPTGPSRVRLTVDQRGEIAIICADLPPNPPFWHVALSEVTLLSDDPWLQIKTSRRAAFDAARAAMRAGIDEAILLNERGEVCEGAITNLFLRRNGKLLTPPLTSGLLPGILRQSLLDSGDAVEAVLTPTDLDQGELFMGNALRGLIPAQLATS